MAASHIFNKSGRGAGVGWNRDGFCHRLARVSVVLALALPALALPALAPRASANDSDAGPQDRILKQVKFEQRLNNQLPLNTVFKDENGDRVALKSYFGDKPVMMVLVYFNCTMLCSAELDAFENGLREVKFGAGKDFNVIALSIDPRETPVDASREKKERVGSYGRPSAVAAWHFLTGDEQSIKAVARSIGFHYAYDPATKEYAHPNGVVVLTPSGKVSRYFYGLDFPTRDLQFGLIDASAGKIGSKIDQISLTCYHYDPLTGKYSLAIMAVIRLCAILTVALLAGGIGLSLLHEKQRARHSIKPRLLNQT